MNVTGQREAIIPAKEPQETGCSAQVHTFFSNKSLVTCFFLTNPSPQQCGMEQRLGIWCSQHLLSG